MATKKYDIALSFAGEDRNYVAKVAKILKNRNIRLFYDEYEEVDMWGKDLSIHLETIYGEKSDAVVIFCSQYYVNKGVPRYELKVALSKAMNSEIEYVLPARFDDTKIPGIPDTTVYFDLREISPEKFAEIIIEKLELLGIRQYPRSSHKEPSGWNRKEGVIQLLSMGGSGGERWVRLQWIGEDLPITYFFDISDEEWSICKASFRGDKKILVSCAPTVSFEHLQNLHDLFLEVIAGP
jgi:hypothetical protein